MVASKNWQWCKIPTCPSQGSGRGPWSKYKPVVVHVPGVVCVPRECGVVCVCVPRECGVLCVVCRVRGYFLTIPYRNTWSSLRLVKEVSTMISCSEKWTTRPGRNRFRDTETVESNTLESKYNIHDLSTC